MDLSDEACPPQQQQSQESISEKTPTSSSASRQLFRTSTVLKPTFSSPTNLVPPRRSGLVHSSPSPSPILRKIRVPQFSTTNPFNQLSASVQPETTYTSPSPTKDKSRLCLRTDLRKKPRTLFNQKDSTNSRSSSSIQDANVNPFTNVSITQQQSKHSHHDSKHCSLEECMENDMQPPPAKRIKIDEVEVPRYTAEFLEVRPIGHGTYSNVRLVRHRLDGVEYAVKISNEGGLSSGYSRARLQAEVFALAAVCQGGTDGLVRYYSSWVEEGRLYIQTEWCNGGSLADSIEKSEQQEFGFKEPELVELCRQIVNGLARMHDAGLAHLDIKPENILLHSGLASTTQYKLADLGNVAKIGGDEVEEGDCRYMAPELLEMDVDTTQLAKADIFSFGLTLFAAASLMSLPRNSIEDPSYEQIMQGNLPYLENCSGDFNAMLRACVNVNPKLRPTAKELLEFPCLTRNDGQHLELKRAKEEVENLRYILAQTELALSR